MKRWIALAAIVAGGLGFAGGRMATPPKGQVVVREERTTVDRPFLRAELRAAVREELAARPECPAPAAAAIVAAPPAPPAPAAPRDEGAAEEAQAVVDAALGRGRWTAEDATVLRALFARLDPDTGRDVLAAVSQAVHDGHLALDVFPPI